MELAKEKKGIFCTVYFVRSMYWIEYMYWMMYWIEFKKLLNRLSKYTHFQISKNITSYTFCLLLKSSKAFSVSLFEKNSVQKFLLFFTRFPKKCYDDIWVLFEKCLDQTFPNDGNLGKNVLRAFPISIWNSFN